MKAFIALLFFLLIPFSSYCEKAFILGRLQGQLGNQLFQIAATFSLALDHNAEPIFPDLIHRKNWEIPLNYQHVFWQLNTDPPTKPIQYHYQEPTSFFTPITYRPNMSLAGFFQSDKYFAHHKDEIIELFAPHPDLVAFLEKKYPFIVNHPYTVSIHVRMYYGSREHYFFNGLSYIEKAITYFPEDAFFVVFSDDISWCKQNLGSLAPNIYFVEGNTHYHDFYLMSLCKHNIISNSSFSWWAAYINQNPEKCVMAPKNWYMPKISIDTRDLYPKSWNVIY